MHDDSDLPVVNAQRLGERCTEAFAALAPALADVLDDRDNVPLCRLRLIERESFEARVRRPGGLADRAIVEVSTGLLVDVHDALSRGSPALARIVAGSTTDALDSDRVLGCLWELSLHFVLLHELYHVHEGHLGWLGETTGLAALSEAHLANADSEGIDPDLAYFLEFEADGSALVSMLVHAEFDALIELIDTQHVRHATATTVHELQGAARAVGYRAVLVALWTTAALMERERRGGSSRLAPEGRLLALVSTLMSWYCELDGFRQTPDGALLHRMDSQDVERAVEFIQTVVAPVAMVLEAFPGRDESGILGFFSDRDALQDFLGDLQSLVGNRRPTGVGGAQLVRCERLRSLLEPALHRWRLIAQGERSRGANMGRLFEVLAEPEPGVSAEQVRAALAEAIETVEGATLESSSVAPAPGMTGTEIAVSFVVSLAAGLTIEGVKAALAAALDYRRLQARLDTTDLEDE